MSIALFINTFVTVQWQKGDLNSNLLESQIFMKGVTAIPVLAKGKSQLVYLFTQAGLWNRGIKKERKKRKKDSIGAKHCRGGWGVDG